MSIDMESTLTSALSANGPGLARLLALTVLWHPDRSRVGEQFVVAPSTLLVTLNRYAPMFARPGGSLLPLGERSITRDALQLQRGIDDSLRFSPPDSRMSVELDGVALSAPVVLPAARVEAGVVMALGGTVLLCVHWADSLPRLNPSATLLGAGSAMLRVQELIRQVAATELPVLLLGETGTGKELAARAIHLASRRHGGPLVAVNMATLSESLAPADLFGAQRGAYTGAQQARPGLFAEAAGGTLFLDEIANTAVTVQPMLLRVLESGEYRQLGAVGTVRTDVRLIAATDADLGATDFNQPLLRRLEAFVIAMPPLRRRREDIGLLIVHLMKEQERTATVPLTLPFALVSALCRYDWPGNVRQLGHVLRRAFLAVQAGQAPSLAELLPSAALSASLPSHLPPSSSMLGAEGGGRRIKLAELDQNAVLAAMDAHGWRISAAAGALGVSRPSMYKLLENHPLVRVAAAIPEAELRNTLASHGADLARCAAVLKTPSEALRRHLREHGMLA